MNQQRGLVAPRNFQTGTKKSKGKKKFFLPSSSKKKGVDSI